MKIEYQVTFSECPPNFNHVTLCSEFEPCCFWSLQTDLRHMRDIQAALIDTLEASAKRGEDHEDHSCTEELTDDAES